MQAMRNLYRVSLTTEEGATEVFVAAPSIAKALRAATVSSKVEATNIEQIATADRFIEVPVEEQQEEVQS